MPKFTPNELQRALFTEVMNATLKGYVASLSERNFNHVAEMWLRGTYPVLTALAKIGKEGVRAGGRGHRNEVLVSMMSCMSSLPHETLRWLNDWECLRELACPQAMQGDDFLAKLEKLASLDEGL